MSDYFFLTGVGLQNCSSAFIVWQFNHTEGLKCGGITVKTKFFFVTLEALGKPVLEVVTSASFTK